MDLSITMCKNSFDIEKCLALFPEEKEEVEEVVRIPLILKSV